MPRYWYWSAFSFLFYLSVCILVASFLFSFCLFVFCLFGFWYIFFSLYLFLFFSPLSIFSYFFSFNETLAYHWEPKFKDCATFLLFSFSVCLLFVCLSSVCWKIDRGQQQDHNVFLTSCKITGDHGSQRIWNRICVHSCNSNPCWWGIYLTSSCCSGNTGKHFGFHIVRSLVEQMAGDLSNFDKCPLR